MPRHPESNPHFWPPQNREQYFQSPSPGGATPLHPVQDNQFPIIHVPRKKDPNHQDLHNQPLGTWATDQHPQPHNPRTTLNTKCFAGSWACFWTVVVLIGLVTLAIYLLSRPHSPKFDVSNVTLNTAYLAPDGLLNADLTMQVKFTNPNGNARMEFNYGFINLYYGRTLIASQIVEPFFLPRSVYSLQVVQMATSTQIQLPEPEMELLRNQLSYNAVDFEIKGVFHTRAKVGSILRYTYRVHVDCTFTVNAPPSGTLTKKYCKVKG